MGKLKTIKIRVVKDGVRVMNPRTLKALQFGITYEVPHSTFWARRLNEGSVEIVKAEKPTSRSAGAGEAGYHKAVEKADKE